VLFLNSYLKALMSNENKRKRRKLTEEGRAQLRNSTSQAIYRPKKLREDPLTSP